MLKLPADMLARHRAAAAALAPPAPGDVLGAGADAREACASAEPARAPSGALAVAPAGLSSSQRGAPAADRWIIAQDLLEAGVGPAAAAAAAAAAAPAAASQLGAAQGAQGPAEGEPEQGVEAPAEQLAAAAVPEGLTPQPRQMLAPGTSLLDGMVTVRPATQPVRHTLSELLAT